MKPVKERHLVASEADSANYEVGVSMPLGQSGSLAFNVTPAGGTPVQFLLTVQVDGSGKAALSARTVQLSGEKIVAAGEEISMTCSDFHAAVATGAIHATDRLDLVSEKALTVGAHTGALAFINATLGAIYSLTIKAKTLLLSANTTEIKANLIRLIGRGGFGQGGVPIARVGDRIRLTVATCDGKPVVGIGIIETGSADWTCS